MLQSTQSLLRKFGGSPAVLKKISKSLLATWKQDYDDYIASLANEDLPGASRALHGLKGSIGYFASDELFLEVQALEEATRIGELKDVQALHPSFDEKLIQFIEELKVMVLELG